MLRLMLSIQDISKGGTLLLTIEAADQEYLLLSWQSIMPCFSRVVCATLNICLTSCLTRDFTVDKKLIFWFFLYIISLISHTQHLYSNAWMSFLMMSSSNATLYNVIFILYFNKWSAANYFSIVLLHCVYHYIEKKTYMLFPIVYIFSQT